jgi:hypothetical protein
VNEVVVPIGLKDTFNTLRPDQDAGVLSGLAVEPFATEGPIPLVTDPILADLIEALYPGVETPPDGSREDLVAIYLTGIDQETADAVGVPPTAQAGGVPAEMLRLNTSIKPNPETQDDLGYLGGDPQGFPNGRRLGDDVVDISLRAVAGGTPFTEDFNVEPNNILTDGAPGNDVPFLTTFPYIGTPHAGYDTGPLQSDIYGPGGS